MDLDAGRRLDVVPTTCRSWMDHAAPWREDPPDPSKTGGPPDLAPRLGAILVRKIDCNKYPSDCTNVHGGSPGFGWLESQLAPRSASHTGIPASVGSLEACAIRFDWRGTESAGGNRHGMAGSGAWMGPPMVVMRLDPPGPYVGGLGLRGQMGGGAEDLAVEGRFGRWRWTPACFSREG